jgi:hypothetical protein
MGAQDDIRVRLNPEKDKWDRYTLLDMKERVCHYADQLAAAWAAPEESRTPDERVRVLKQRLRSVNELMAMNSLWLDAIKKSGKATGSQLDGCLAVTSEFGRYLEKLKDIEGANRQLNKETQDVLEDTREEDDPDGDTREEEEMEGGAVTQKGGKRPASARRRSKVAPQTRRSKPAKPSVRTTRKSRR